MSLMQIDVPVCAPAARLNGAQLLLCPRKDLRDSLLRTGRRFKGE